MGGGTQQMRTCFRKRVRTCSSRRGGGTARRAEIVATCHHDFFGADEVTEIDRRRRLHAVTAPAARGSGDWRFPNPIWLNRVSLNAGFLTQKITFSKMVLGLPHAWS